MSKKIPQAEWMVLRALSFGPKTQPQIAEHTTLSRETVRKSILKLNAQGQVTRKGGVYELADVQVAA